MNDFIHTLKRELVSLEADESGNVAATVYVTDAMDEETADFLLDISNDVISNAQHEVGFEIQVPLAMLLDQTIEGNRLYSSGRIDIAARPMLMQAREELRKLIAQIDGLEFE